MAELTARLAEVSYDPLETVERLAAKAGMDVSRPDEMEVQVNAEGSWRDISLWFAWRPEAQAVQLAVPLEMRVTKERHNDVIDLLVRVNERLWLGHFDLWEGDRGLIYRNSAILTDNHRLDDGQAEILIRAAVDAFERYFPAFNYVIWGGKSPSMALDAAICDTVGSA